MMFEAKNNIEILNREYLKRVRQNPSYSKRAFAKLLEVSPGALSEILNEKRKISVKSAKKIAGKLGFSVVETKRFINLCLEDDVSEEVAFSEVEINNLDAFYVISEWYCFAILNLSQLKKFSWKESWIASKLNISVVEVKTALEKLQKVGLIKKFRNGFKLTHENFEASSQVPSQAIKNHHSQILDLAKRAIDFQQVDEREISGISFNVNDDDLVEIKNEINEFQNYLANKYNKEKADHVYQFENCFFKLTRDI